MNIIVNGLARELSDGAVVADVVAKLSAAPQGIAVAVNGSVVSRGAWATTRLDAGDKVEVLTAVQGG
jgi:sulfur carrier protein